MLLVQISWFLEFAPDWLGPVIILLGIPFLIFPLVRGGVNEGGLPIESSNRPSPTIRALGHLFISVAFVLLAAPSLLRNMNTLGVLLFLMGSWIEGIGASKLFWKVIHYLLYRKTRGDIQDTRRLIYYFLLVFIFIISAGIFVLVLSQEPTQNPMVLMENKNVLLLWTFFTLATSLLGLTYKLWGLNPPEDADRAVKNHYGYLLFGAVLSVSGAEIFNFQLLTQQSPMIANEILISSIGLIVYSIGYWISVISIVTNR